MPKNAPGSQLYSPSSGRFLSESLTTTGCGMLQIHSDQVFTLGVIAGVPQTVVFKEALRNLPEEGLYNWDPGAFFGIYHLDSLWFETNDEAN